jgi:hypothetical protein
VWLWNGVPIRTVLDRAGSARRNVVRLLLARGCLDQIGQIVHCRGAYAVGVQFQGRSVWSGHFPDDPKTAGLGQERFERSGEYRDGPATAEFA